MAITAQAHADEAMAAIRNDWKEKVGTGRADVGTAAWAAEVQAAAEVSLVREYKEN